MADDIAFGCAQLGMPYGVANSEGQPDAPRVEEMIDLLLKGGVRYFDTAPAYGSSESVLGQALRRLGATDRVRVISKVSATPKNSLRTSVMRSLERLNVSRLYGLLLHDESMLDDWNDRYHEPLRQLQDEGLVEHVGVSIYSDVYAELALANPSIELLQVPFNIMDNRASEQDWFGRAHRAGKQIFTRSLYLQGLLAMSSDALPESMAFARSTITAYTQLCAAAGLTPKEMATTFSRCQATDAIIIFGAETVDQIRETLGLLNQNGDAGNLPLDTLCALAADADPRIKNPVLW